MPGRRLGGRRLRRRFVESGDNGVGIRRVFGKRERRIFRCAFRLCKSLHKAAQGRTGFLRRAAGPAQLQQFHLHVQIARAVHLIADMTHPAKVAFCTSSR